MRFRKTTTFLVSTLLSAGLGLGATAVAAEAAPKASHSKSVKSGKADAAAKRLAAARKQTLREVAHKDVQLARALKADHLAVLDPDVASTLVASVAADRASLAELKAVAEAAATVAELKALRKTIGAVRPEVYKIAVGALAEAAALETAVAELEAGLDPLTADPAVLDLVTAAYDALAAVTDAALVVTAFDKATAHAVNDALALAEAAVVALETAVATPDVPEEPVV